MVPFRSLFRNVRPVTFLGTLLIIFASYLVPGATTDDPLGNHTNFGLNVTHSFPCPIGYYCLSGAQVPSACPNGTYNDVEYGGALSNCTYCPIDHYNHLEGQKACFQCGGQAKQPYPKQDKCLCNGLHRVFMVCLFCS